MDDIDNLILQGDGVGDDVDGVRIDYVDDEDASARGEGLAVRGHCLIFDQPALHLHMDLAEPAPGGWNAQVYAAGGPNGIFHSKASIVLQAEDGAGGVRHADHCRSAEGERSRYGEKRAQWGRHSGETTNTKKRHPSRQGTNTEEVQSLLGEVDTMQLVVRVMAKANDTGNELEQQDSAAKNRAGEEEAGHGE